jgi:hypothetical protein
MTLNENLKTNLKRNYCEITRYILRNKIGIMFMSEGSNQFVGKNI